MRVNRPAAAGNRPAATTAQRYNARPLMAPAHLRRNGSPIRCRASRTPITPIRAATSIDQDAGGWQQNTGGTWSSASGDTSWADQESQARANSDVAAASYGMSNADRFTNAPNTGWNARDRGDGGYSRTLGGARRNQFGVLQLLEHRARQCRDHVVGRRLRRWRHLLHRHRLEQPVPLAANATHRRLSAVSRNASDSRQFKCGMANVDARHQAQHVQFEPFIRAGDDTEQAQQRQLNAGAAGRL